MAQTFYRAYPWARRETLGNVNYKNIYSNTFGYTVHAKKIAAGTSTAVLAATAAAQTVVTVTSGITQPDVPRTLSVTPSGNATNILDGAVTIIGHNVEGKVINEVFHVPNGSTTLISGGKAFLDITSIVLGQMGGTDVSFAVGTTNKLGVNHRLFAANTTVKVYTATAAAGGSALTLQNAPTVVASDTIELNTVLPATIPNGSLIFNIFYSFDAWSLGGVEDIPIYSITTSTSSTSTSTSTTTVTTSTSSTSTSTSSTSTSTSSTSTSTSSTSTSTTTVA